MKAGAQLFRALAPPAAHRQNDRVLPSPFPMEAPHRGFGGSRTRKGGTARGGLDPKYEDPKSLSIIEQKAIPVVHREGGSTALEVRLPCDRSTRRSRNLSQCTVPEDLHSA